MKINSNYKLYYVKDSEFNGGIKEIQNFECFDNVNLPTMFELEIHRNGVLGHPYESTNSWDYQNFEDYHQFYVLNFSSNKKHKFIKFHGIDTIAHIYANGELIGKTNNMFISYTFELNNLKKENQLIIHILPAVLEGKKYEMTDDLYTFIYNYESLYLRKTPSSFGWDILPRTPLGGIHKDVELLDKLPLIKDIEIKANKISKKEAVLAFSVDVTNKEAYSIKIEGKCGKSSFVLDQEGEVTIEKPKLWNIRGYGKPNLYKIKVSLISKGKVVETKTIKYGIRKIELKRTSVVKKGGKFEFHINGKKVFLLGSNWVPIEAIKHIDDERMLKTLDMLVDLNCNCIRVWGGGTYESDLFYEKCDELGILVWQDFMMGCASYPQVEEFQNRLREEVVHIVKHLRNHPCIGLWAGDNEDDLATLFWNPKKKTSPNKNVLTRKVIPEVLEELDNYRPYLPSSPYIDKYAEKHQDMALSEDHLWGPRDYFKGEFYRNAKPYFTSETGYHAMCSYESLIKFIKEPWPIFVNKDYIYEEGKRKLSEANLPTKEYLCHAVSIMDDYNSPFSYRVRLMTDQVLTLFKNDIDNIHDFITASQISQAEAMKYFVERMRRDMKRNGGIIWWNIIDGWPQAADSIVDYYFCKKHSYYYLKRSQVNNLLMLNEDDDGLNLYCVSSDKKKHVLTYQIIDAYKDEVIEEGEIASKPGKSFIHKSVTAPDKTLLVIKYKDEKGNEYINHFHTHIIDIDLYQYVDAMKKYNLM